MPFAIERGTAHIAAARARLLTWYDANGRHDLRWRKTRDPYAVLVSEVMLQQTQVERVVPKYREFLAAFPTLAALAEAPAAEVIRRWAPLGYNRRAVRLREAARIAAALGGLPAEPQALRALPGIGPYTAAAVACFAFGRDVAVVDTNIRRVLGRAVAGDAAVGEGVARRIAESLLPPGRARDWNLALMDLGATVCTARSPACGRCPLTDACAWRTSPPRSLSPQLRRGGWRQPGGEVVLSETRAPYRTSERFAGSRRYYRGRIVDALRALPDGASLPLAELGRAVRPDYGNAHASWLRDLVASLASDGLAEVEGGGVRLP